jgi:hypothetical protein
MEICFAEITRHIQKNSTHPNHHLALFNGAFSSRTKLALNSLPPFGARSPKAKHPKSKAENPPDKFTNTLQAFTAERRKAGWWISRPWTPSPAEKPQWSGPFAKTYSFPGNPDIDSNLNKPNAPIPTHGNL